MWYNVYMIFFIHGQESFLAYQQLAETKKRFLEKNPDGYNLSVFSLAESFDLEEIKNSLQNFSLFSSKVKLIVLKDFFSSKNDAQKEKLINFFVEQNFKTSKTSHIIFFESSDTSKDSFYVKVKDIANESIARELSLMQVEKWAALQFQKENISVSAPAVKKLVLFAGKDLWKLNSEIEKLISWLISQDKNSLSDNNVDSIIARVFEKDIFKTIEAISRKDFPAAARLLANHFENNENEFYILSMIAYQFRNLIKIKSALNINTPINELAKKLKMNPYVLKKTLEQTSKYSFEGLKEIYKKILEIEGKMKKGADSKQILNEFVMEVCC